MDRTLFLNNLRSSKPVLHKVPIDGWEEPVYMRQSNVGEIKVQIDIAMAKAAAERKKDANKSAEEVAGEEVADSIQRDPLYLARGIAAIVRNERGELVFDEADDAQMQELMDALAESASYVHRQITEAFNKINSAAPSEVTPKGN